MSNIPFSDEVAKQAVRDIVALGGEWLRCFISETDAEEVTATWATVDSHLLHLRLVGGPVEKLTAVIGGEEYDVSNVLSR